MAARGGRGGRGRGGAKAALPMGHLAYADIIAYSKEGTDILYPPHPADFKWKTADPNDREAEIASCYNKMVAEMKFTPFWIDAPTRSNTDIERYSDRFKKGNIEGEGATTLQTLHAQRRYDKGLLPNAVFEAVLEKSKKRGRASEARGRRAKVRNVDALLGDEDVPRGAEPAENADSEAEEDEMEPLEGEEEEEENDYDDNYFDNGEDDGDDYDVGGGGGGDDDGGTFD